MAISLEGQYYFSLDISNLAGDKIQGEGRDFVDEGNLTYFSIRERAGGSLPEYDLTFLSQSDEILSFLNLGSRLLFSLGRDQNSIISGLLTISKIIVTPAGGALRSITIRGFLSAEGYLTNSKIRSFINKSGVEVIREVADEYFNVPKHDPLEEDGIIETSSDRQNWFQPNFTDTKFIADTWPHCDLPKSFIGIGINSEGDFLVKDMRRTIGRNRPNKASFSFSSSSFSEENIVYQPNPRIEYQPALFTSLAGRGLDQTIYEIDEGRDRESEEQVEPILSSVDRIPKPESEKMRVLSPAPINENVHKNYWVARNRNFSGLASASSLKVLITIKGQFVDVSALDVVNFQDIRLQDQSDEGAYSGQYWVSSIQRILKERVLYTDLELVRESINFPKGDF